MDPVSNPYAPGAGRPPAALVGREAQLTAWDVALRRVQAGRDAQSMVLYGLRGVGKTVLLSRFARLAHERGWIVAQVEGRTGASLRDGVGEAFHADLVDLARPGVGKRVLKALQALADEGMVSGRYTLPGEEYAQFVELRRKLEGLGVPAKKNQLLRAGLQVLAQLPQTELVAALAALPALPDAQDDASGEE